MEVISTQKQLTLRKKSETKQLLTEAIDHHKHCEAACSAVLRTQQVALWHAWQVGIRLNHMKALIHRGDWLDWLDINFCKPLKVSIRTAQVYMKIDTENAELREEAKTQRVAPAEADFQLLTRLKSDTIRKYAFGFVPKKHEPNKDRDIRFGRLYSFLNIINEYNRVKHRHVMGLQAVDFVELREEAVEIYQFLQWVYGDSECNPWDSSAFDDRRKPAALRNGKRISEIDLQRSQQICAIA